MAEFPIKPQANRATAEIAKRRHTSRAVTRSGDGGVRRTSGSRCRSTAFVGLHRVPGLAATPRNEMNGEEVPTWPKTGATVLRAATKTLNCFSRSVPPARRWRKSRKPRRCVTAARWPARVWIGRCVMASAARASLAVSPALSAARCMTSYVNMISQAKEAANYEC